VIEVRIRIKRVAVLLTSLIVNAFSVMSGLIMIFKMYDLTILFIIQTFKISDIYSSKKETHSEILGRYRNKQISSKAMFN
jgi:hypothetical protein